MRTNDEQNVSSVETNEPDQAKKDISVVMPPYVLAFGVEALTALIADYDFYEDKVKQGHAKSGIELLSYLTPHLDKVYNL